MAPFPRKIEKTRLAMGKLIYLPLIFLFSAQQLLPAQPADVQIKVYDFDDGLSHRNVFKIAQDTAGFIWLATINGLSRFDGYSFVHYHSRAGDHRLPHDAISDMVIDEKRRIWLANPDYLTRLNPETNQFRTIKMKDGPIVRRESKVPHNLLRDPAGRLWTAVYDERSANTHLEVMLDDSLRRPLHVLAGKYTRRPLAWLAGRLYLGAFENELWRLDEKGDILEKITFPAPRRSRSAYRITHLQAGANHLWVLLNNGALYRFDPATSQWEAHPITSSTQGRGIANTFLRESNGDVWLGGQGILWHYEAATGAVTDYNDPISQIVKNTCTYRQIFKDRSEVIWIASNFGAVKIARSDDLFTQYLNGGSEYCSNVYCSTRGITEDDRGLIYVSYYNSIHVISPENNAVRPLFPANDYFNYPFGLTYHDDALYTGNGRRIDLNTLGVDTLFDHPSVDLGAVVVDAENRLWFGYRHWLYRYDPEREVLNEYQDSLGRWDSLQGTISYLYQGRRKAELWVGTLENGLFLIDKEAGSRTHFSTQTGSAPRLRDDNVNAIYEDPLGRLWIGTGGGLHCYDRARHTLQVYNTEDGLPNNFVNGILPEGDSCLWISTNDGLCRFSIRLENCLNFFQKDGISSNEFNRISFYKARNGRMYFGGLDGVNAFYPSPRFLEEKEEQMDAPLLLTNFTKLDGAIDSLYSYSSGLHNGQHFHLSHQDKIFSFTFALADYRQPMENRYSYRLDGYEKEWSPASTVNMARYNNIPAGQYTFRVRARSGKNLWNAQELAIPVSIEEAYYRTWWFWSLCLLMIGGLVYGFVRYRIYALRKREKALERLVSERTQELEREKRKSEELLLNILPAETAEELKTHGSARAKRHEVVTVMFSDFQGFSKISGRLEPEVLVAEIDYCFRNFDRITDRHHLEKIKTIGDAYMCMCIENESQPLPAAVRMINAALEIQEFMETTADMRRREGRPYFETRIGIHTGPVVAGIVGIKKFAYDIWGDTVNIASRMETNGEIGKVNISETTFRRVQESFICRYHGDFSEEEGVSVGMYFVEGTQALERKEGGVL